MRADLVKALPTDNAYNVISIREELAEADSETVIQPRASRRMPIPMIVKLSLPQGRRTLVQHAKKIGAGLQLLR